jgi:hypothetical protein
VHRFFMLWDVFELCMSFFVLEVPHKDLESHKVCIISLYSLA